MKKCYMLLLSLFLGGCFTTSVHTPDKIAYDAKKESTKIDGIQQDIHGKAVDIKQKGVEINSATKDVIVKEGITEMIEKSDGIIKDNKKLSDISSGLVILQKDINITNDFLGKSKVTEKNNKELRDKLDLANSDAEKKHQTIWLTVTGFACAGLALGLLMLFSPVTKDWGIPVIAVSVAMSSISYFMVKYVIVVAWIGGGIVLTGVGFLLYKLYKITTEKDQVKLELGDRSNALNEVVTGVELLKHTHRDAWTAKVSDMKAIQSEKTKNIVKDIKQNIVNK